MHTLVVAPRLGGRSEPWLWRQLTSFQRLEPRVLVSEWVNRNEYPFDDRRVSINSSLMPREQGFLRWAHRMRGLPQGNFFAPSAGEAENLLGAVRDWPRPAVALCHFGHVAVRFAPLAQRLGIPLVAHFHGLDASAMLQEHRWYRWSLRANRKSFAAVVVVGRRQRAVLEQLGFPEGKIHVIPCGAPISAQVPPKTRTDDRVRFVTVSRLVPWKGVHITLRAYARARRHLPDSTLFIVGEGPQEAELRVLADELGIASDVSFLGAVGQDEVHSVLREADVLVQNSLEWSNGWFEGFGVNVTEAADAALPVVVSESGGLIDQVVDGETGILVPVGDVDATATAMHRLAIDPALRSRLGQAARVRAERHFDARSLALKLEQLLLHVGQGQDPS